MDPRTIALTVAVALLVPAAAGCLGGSDADGSTGPAEAGDGDDGVTSQGPTAADAGNATGPPDWQVGDWFEYDRSGPWTVEGTSRLVVTEAGEEGYVTGLTNRSQARIDVYWSNDPLLGSLGAALEPPVHEAPPAVPTVLDFPLRDGKSWSTNGWGGQEPWTWTFDVSAVDEVDTPAGARSGFEIRGEASTNFTIEATYVPSIGTLTRFEGAAPDATVYAYELTGFGDAHEGRVWTASRTVHVESMRYSAEDLVPPVVDVAVPAEATDLVATVSQFSATVSATSLVDPDGNVRHLAATTPASTGAFAEVIVRDPPSGTWRWVMQAAGSGPAPVSCGPDAPRNLLCGGVFLRAATMQMEEVQIGQAAS